MRKPREPDENTGLKHTAARGSRARAPPPRPRARPAPAGIGRRKPEPLQERVRLGLVVRAVDRVGRRDEHRRSLEGSSAPASPSRSNDDCGRIASAPSRSATRGPRPANCGSEPAGTRWNASQRCRPTDRSLMSVPTSRTSRSPFSRSPRRSAAVPGAPEAVTTTVIGSREVDPVARSCSSRAARSASRNDSHRLAHRRPS